MFLFLSDDTGSTTLNRTERFSSYKLPYTPLDNAFVRLPCLQSICASSMTSHHIGSLSVLERYKDPYVLLAQLLTKSDRLDELGSTREQNKEALCLDYLT